MTPREKQKLARIDKKATVCFRLSFGLILALTLVKMVFSNRAATWGHALEEIKKDTYALQKQTQGLKSQLAQTTGSLDQLADQARQQGFTDKPNYQYFTSGPTVAQKLP
jgi:septal ring factor EnvC (AmiA/AmiB activator)